MFTDASFLSVFTRLAEACCEHGAISRTQAGRVDRRSAGTCQGRPAVRGSAHLHRGGDESLRGVPGRSADHWG